MIPVLVTNKHRGIYFGYAESMDRRPDGSIVLEKARHCFYYAQCAGTYSLATSGPMQGSKVSPELPQAVINDVANVVRCTDEAVERWMSASWPR